MTATNEKPGLTQELAEVQIEKNYLLSSKNQGKRIISYWTEERDPKHMIKRVPAVKEDQRTECNDQRFKEGHKRKTFFNLFLPFPT